MSDSIAQVARDQLRSLAALMKGTWEAKLAQTLVAQFAALAELAHEKQNKEMPSLARAISATVQLYVRQGPDEIGRGRLMDLGRKLNLQLDQMKGKADSAKPSVVLPEIKYESHFRLVYLLTDPDPAIASVGNRELAQALAERQFALHVFVEGDQFSEAIVRQAPAAVICEAVLMPALSELLDNIEREQPGLSTRIALLAINKTTSAARRLTAALGWADIYLEAPSAVEIAEQLEELSSPKSEAPYQVLIVDDDRQQAMFCSGVLKRKGMEVTSALSAEDALKVLATMRPDLVLMDLYLPGINGMELTAILRERSDSLLLPIVFLSGEQDAQKRFDALNIGGDDYLTKPIRPRHLSTAVASRIKRVRALRLQLAEARAPKDHQGIYRRARFLELLQTEAEASPGSGARALNYLSIDFSAQVLWELGMLAQSQLEQSILTRLSTCLDHQDALSSLGNFEYAVLAKRTNSEALVRLSEKLRSCISALGVPLGDDEFALTMSVGISDHVDARGGAERWLSLAQMAAQRAQRQGGNRVERGLRESLQVASAKAELIDEMLKESPGRANTLIEYQPLVPLSGAPLHQYVLDLHLRGNTVATSQVHRGDYFGPAERSGAITKLDRFACQQAIAAIREGGRAMASTRVLVRCSVAALLHDLVQTMKSELSNSSVNPSQLLIEFDTSEVELDYQNAFRKIEQLRALGVTIAANVSLLRTRTLAMLRKMKPDLVSIHGALLVPDSANAADAANLIQQLDSSISVCAFQVSSPLHIETLWQLRIGYMMAEFLGPTRAQMDFNFSSGKRPAEAA